MLCTRCGGRLVRERLFEVNGMSSTERVDCERCLNHGAVEDAIIRANRQTAHIPVRSRKPQGPRRRDALSSRLADLSHESAPADIPDALAMPQRYRHTGRPGSQTYGYANASSYRGGTDETSSNSSL